MSADRSSRRRKRLLAVALALCAGFAVLEVAARVAVGTPLRERLPLMRVRANPHRGWEMVPGEEHYTYQHRVRVNALGLRGAELQPRVPGERRVLFLGDSLTYGQGVADDETVPAALERALRARDPGRAWTVVNGGNRAYGTAQELGLLEELGPRIEPDVVLLGWYWNDVEERPVQATYEAFRARGAFEFDGRDRRDGWSPLWWRLQQLPRASAVVMLFHDLTSPLGELYPREVVEAGLARLGPLLERFRTSSAELGATPVVALFPDRNRLEGRDDTRSIEELCIRLSRERGLAVIELLPALAPVHAARGELPVLPFDGHYDAEANLAMGEHLAADLLALGVPERAE